MNSFTSVILLGLLALGHTSPITNEESHTTITAVTVKGNNLNGILSHSEGSTTTEATNHDVIVIDLRGFGEPEELMAITEETDSRSGRVQRHSDTQTSFTVQPTQSSAVTSSPESEDKGTATQREGEEPEGSTMWATSASLEGSAEEDEESHTTTVTTTVTTTAAAEEENNPDGIGSDSGGSTTEATTTEATTTTDYPCISGHEGSVTTDESVNITKETIINATGSLSDSEAFETPDKQLTTTQETTTIPPSLDEVVQQGRGFNLTPDRGDPPTPIQEVNHEEVKEEEKDAKEGTEMHKGHVTPDWIIILGFLVGVAVLVLLCVAIATRDKWNRPNQFNNTGVTVQPADLHRAEEMETFLHNEQPRENGKAEEYTVIPLDELPHSYSS